MNLFPPHMADFYKTGHIKMYPKNTTRVYSNFAARSNKLFKTGTPFVDDKVVWAGLQGVCQWMLIDLWNRDFFHKPKDTVVAKYKRRMDTSLGPDAVAVSHIAALHDLGYLPIEIKSLPEGSLVNLRVPMFTVMNTHDEFEWVTNYIETQLSAECWKTPTAATIAFLYRRILEFFAEMTGSPMEFVSFQGHDFSARGMSGNADAAHTGLGHLLSVVGTDTIHAIDYAEDYYSGDQTFVGCSVPATEHSVQCMGGEEGESETFRRLICDTYPSGIVSIVSDTWDLWNVLTKIAPSLKAEIEARQPDALGNAKVVFRPDSGDPVDIVCGDASAPVGSPAHKGALQCLWEAFGGTVNEKGYKVLNPRVGLIYGDSITPERCYNMLRRMTEMGFASCNMVFGIGSFTYQHVTRDTFSFAYKATWGVVDGEDRELLKDPVTGDGTKKSAKGLLRVEQDVHGNFQLYDQQTREQEAGGLLQTVFKNGRMVHLDTLAAIRERLHGKSII